MLVWKDPSERLALANPYLPNSATEGEGGIIFKSLLSCADVIKLSTTKDTNNSVIFFIGLWFLSCSIIYTISIQAITDPEQYRLCSGHLLITHEIPEQLQFCFL